MFNMRRNRNTQTFSYNASTRKTIAVVWVEPPFLCAAARRFSHAVAPQPNAARLTIGTFTVNGCQDTSGDKTSQNTTSTDALVVARYKFYELKARLNESDICIQREDYARLREITLCYLASKKALEGLSPTVI